MEKQAGHEFALETGMQRGLSPLAKSRAVYTAHGLQNNVTRFSCGKAIFRFKASGLLPEGIRNTFQAEKGDVEVMLDKQDRYRKRKTEQGLHRVEVLIPQGAVPLLKAYARALRDAHSLGLDAPLFDGMEYRTDHRPTGAATTRHAPKPRTGDTANAIGTRTATLEANADRRSKKCTPDKVRPDFSKGLLDE